MSKYIDADAWSKKLQDEFHGMISDESLRIYQILQRLEALPAADVEPVRKWIPCSERLPKYGEVVLCLCQNNGITVSCITYEKEKPREIARFGQHYVKAWMPLSVLPKMDGGDEE